MNSKSSRSKSTTLTRQRPMRQTLFVASVVALVLVLTITVAVVASTAMQGAIGPSGVLSLLIFGGLALIASLATTEVIPWGARDISHWKQPKVLGAVGMAIVVATGALFSLLPLVQKQEKLAEVIAKDPKIETISEGISASNGKLDGITQKFGIGQTSLIAQHISGLWGERGNSVLYRFKFDKDTDMLIIRSVPGSDPEGVHPYHGEFRRLTDNDVVTADGPRQSVMVADERVGFNPGNTVYFTLTGIGASQELRWGPSTRNGVDLVRPTQAKAP